MASVLTFFRAVTQRGDEFLNHMVRVTGDETRVLLVNDERKKTVKAVDAHTFTKKVGIV
jgi:hypothetical protein